jgi:fatty acid desaturase
LLGGLSLGWWQNKHSLHHANPNKHGKDPDVASGALALTPYTRAERTGLGAYLADRQGWFFFPLLLLEGLNLHVRSVQRLLSRAKAKYRVWELTFLTIRFGSYFAALLIIMSPGKAIAFLGLQLALYGLYMGSAFAPNHIGMPIVPPTLKIDFLSRQFLMSRNVTGGRFINFLLGGLNYQIEHHLFPSMPRPHLARARLIVREHCAALGLPYTETSLVRSYAIVVAYLNRVGLAARDPFDCPMRRTLRGY